MKAKQVKGFECPECGEWVPTPTKEDIEIRYECGECGEVYADREDAVECCKD